MNNNFTKRFSSSNLVMIKVYQHMLNLAIIKMNKYNRRRWLDGRKRIFRGREFLEKKELTGGSLRGSDGGYP